MSKIYIGVFAAVALVILVRRRNGSSVKPVDNQEELLANALENDDYENLLGDDTSPDYIIIPADGNTMSVADRAAMISKIYADSKVEVDKIAAALAVSSADAMDLIAQTMLKSMEARDKLSEDGCAMYLKLVAVWTTLFATISVGASNAIGQALIGIGETLNNATQCVQTVLVKDITTESTATQQKYSTVTAEMTSWSAVFGLVKGDSATNSTVTGSITTRTDTRKVAYVPHCLSWAVDPLKVQAILAAQTLTIAAIFGQLQAVIAMCPNPYRLKR